jgi:hypothetical protein
MKNINIKKLWVVVACVATFTGCKKDFLETTPTTSINSSEAFSSKEKIDAAVTGIYDLSSNGSFKYDMILANDIKGTDFVLLSNADNYGRFVDAYQYIETPNTTYVTNYWTIGYRLINNANQFEQYIPTSPLTDTEKNAYLAETRALRAETYFWLIQWFAKPYNVDPEALGLPLVTQPLGPNDPLGSRAKVKDVYAQIISDLKFAEANIPASKNNIYRLTKGAVQGLLARVYLSMSNWPEASSYAKLARVGRPLGSAQSLLDGFIDPTSEWIYAINSRSDDNAGYITVHSFYCAYLIGYGSFLATKPFLDSFSAADLRKKQFLIPDNPNNPASSSDYVLLNGDGWNTHKFWFFKTPAQNQVIMRSSEMYLIEAEAEARQGAANEAAAKLALQVIQNRAMPGVALSANTGTALIDEIMAERARELYGEGFKYFDLLRTKKNIIRTAVPDPVNGAHWSAINFQPGDNRLVLPIPQAELNANPILKGQQNPGYSN